MQRSDFPNFLLNETNEIVFLDFAISFFKSFEKINSK